MNNYVLLAIAAGIVMGLLLIIYFLLKTIKAKKLEPKIIELITKAEAKFKSGNGSIKFEYVFDELYNKYAPVMIKVLFSAAEIRAMIQYVFDKIKIALDYNAEWFLKIARCI